MPDRGIVVCPSCPVDQAAFYDIVVYILVVVATRARPYVCAIKSEHIVQVWYYMTVDVGYRRLEHCMVCILVSASVRESRLYIFKSNQINQRVP